jgi:hypothetical protein
MRNCGLPIPKKLKTKIENILNSFTDELWVVGSVAPKPRRGTQSPEPPYVGVIK